VWANRAVFPHVLNVNNFTPSPPPSGCRAILTLWTVVWLSYRTLVDDQGEEKSLSPLRGIEIRHTACSLVTIATELPQKYLNIPFKSSG
jgi:hypothetical protein